MYGVGGDVKHIARIFGNGTVNDADGNATAVRVAGAPNPYPTGVAPIVAAARVIPAVDPPISTPDGALIFKAQFDARDENHARAFVRSNAERNGTTFADDAAFDKYFASAATHTESSLVHFEKRISLDDFKPALLKIVYELAWRWLGDRWLDSSIAKAINIAIFNGLDAAEPIRAALSLGDDSHWPLRQADDDAAMHVMVLIPAPDAIGVAVRLFKHFYATVIVSQDSRRYFPGTPLTLDYGKIILQYRGAARREESLAAYFASKTTASP
jgi:hypothetical protein